MTMRPVPNSITLASLDGLPDATTLVERPYADIRDGLLALFDQHLGNWDSDPDRPLYKALELDSAVHYAGQGFYNEQIARIDPRNWDLATAQLVGALLGVLLKDGETLAPYRERVLNRQVADDDTGTYVGLIATMLRYPALNIASAHAAIETTNRDVVNCYALKIDGDGLKQILTDAERATFGTYTAPPMPGEQPSTDGYLNARDRSNFGRFYRVEALATVTYTVAIKVFYDDTLHTETRLDGVVRDAVIAWAFAHDRIGRELRPRLLESALIDGEEGVHDAKVTITTSPVIAVDADDVYPPDDDRHYRGPTPAERDTGITLTWEAI